MRAALIAMCFALSAAILGVIFFENERITRELRVKADDTTYDYALAVTPQAGGNVIGYNLHYTSEQCETSKKFVMQQGGVKAACVPMPKPKQEEHH